MKRWQTATPSLFLFEHVLSWEDGLPDPVRPMGTLAEELVHFERGKFVTRSMASAKPTRRATWAREILKKVTALAIQRLIFDGDSPLREALLFRVSFNRVVVFYQFADRRVYTCAIRNPCDLSREFYAFAKVLATDPTRRPTRAALIEAAPIVPLTIEFLGPAEDNVKTLSDMDALRSQFREPMDDSFHDVMKSYGSRDSTNMTIARRRLWRFFLRDALIAMRRFMAPLNRDALTIARPNSVNGAEAYHYYAIAEDHVRRYRQQAATSFPILAGLLPRWHGVAEDVFRVQTSAARQRHLLRMGIGNIDYPNRLATIRAVDAKAARLGLIAETIDKAKSLNNALAEALKLSPATIKWLRTGAIGYPRLSNFEEFCRIFECIPVNLRPRRAEDFHMLEMIVSKMKALLNPVGLSPESAALFYERQIDIVCRWLQPVAREAHRHGWKDALRSIHVDQEDLKDFLRAFSEWVASSHMSNLHQARRELFTYYGLRREYFSRDGDETLIIAYRQILDLYARGSIRQLIKLAADWHEAIPHCRREVVFRRRQTNPLQYRDGVSIMPLILRKPCMVEGLMIVPLLSPHALDAEGSAMNHCVGGYSDRAQRFDSVLFSIRGTDGARISTLELRPGIVSIKIASDGEERMPTVQFEFVQHKAPRNLVPPQSAQRVVSRFLQDANHFCFDFTENGSLTRFRRVRKRRRIPHPWEDEGHQITVEANAMALARLLPDFA